jgi:hypothetical protein
MDAKITRGREQLECLAADARGPFGRGQGRGLLAGRQAAGVGIGRQDGQAVGRRLGSGPADARGPFELSEHYRKSMLSYNPKKRIRGTHRAFRETLIDALLLQYKIVPSRIYTNPRHLPISQLDRLYDLHEKVKTSYCGRCHFCRFREDMLEKQLGYVGSMGSSKNVRQTQVICRHCNVYLCAKCFLLFHDFKSIQ